ncbi:MAG: branched-chain amino acid ABC transporter permease [Alphaproteobacteria bacterium]|nr:branched-chain amino acid ABC transporter permease [Alphaproteobacteria bacterium]
MYAVLALGQLSLGQAAFMGIGAYTGALLSLNFGMPFALVLAIAAVVPAVAALVIGGPALRLTGVHLAIATIGFGEVLRVFYINSETLGGGLGLTGIPQRADGWTIYGILGVALGLFTLASRSKIGRAWEAIREDEDAAKVAGINVTAYKMVAVILSAALAGLAGALNAHCSSFIGPGEYGFDAAVTVLSFALLGGVSMPLGPVVGAFLLGALPEVLRPLHDFRLIFNGLIIVVVVIFLPRGLLGFRVRRMG